jgi:hypothetical protein
MKNKILVKQCAWTRDILLNGMWVAEKIAMKTLAQLHGGNVASKIVWTHGIREDVFDKLMQESETIA